MYKKARYPRITWFATKERIQPTTFLPYIASFDPPATPISRILWQWRVYFLFEIFMLQWQTTKSTITCISHPPHPAWPNTLHTCHHLSQLLPPSWLATRSSSPCPPAKWQQGCRSQNGCKALWNKHTLIHTPWQLVFRQNDHYNACHGS